MSVSSVSYERLRQKAVPLSAAQAALEATHGCQMPGCPHAIHDRPMVISGQCHPGARTNTVFYRGSIFVSCADCGEFIVRFEVV